jgi:hypothetical protein
MKSKAIFGVEDIDISIKPNKSQLPPLVSITNDLFKMSHDPFSGPQQRVNNKDDLDMRELKAYLKV